MKNAIFSLFLTLSSFITCQAQHEIEFDKPIFQFNIQIPDNYNFNDVLNILRKNEADDSKCECNLFGFVTAARKNEIRQASKPEHRLQPGQSYTVKIVPIVNLKGNKTFLNSVSRFEIVQYIKSQNAIRVGSEGLLYFMVYYRDKFPLSSSTMSLGLPEDMINEDCYDLNIPTVYRPEGSAVAFNYNYRPASSRFVDYILIFTKD